jgi:anaerobic ribonucleoside-triphosphate reductase
MPDKELLAKIESKRTKCVVYTRVMGYHRPVESFNVGKKGEFAQRQHFREDTSKNNELVC